ncbi:MAG: glycosyltransferase family 10 domain-containing protein [Acidimicrobiia bacterium]
MISFYNRFFEDWPEVPDRCPTECRFTTGPREMEDADAVVFHVPTLGSIDGLRKRPGQLWVAWSMESRAMCPPLDDSTFMRRFDLTMTYERSSDVWDPYFGPGTVPGLKQPVAARTAAAPVVWLQSNARDRCGRRAFAAELMRQVRVDSFGTVLRNQVDLVPPGHCPRIALYGRYKFTLAFENSFARDYVTEKLYEPLTAGSVPVYRGSSDVGDLAPALDSYIDARDFASAAELGAYLDHLDQHDDAYLAYHEWRSRPWSSSFLAHLDELRDRPLCRLSAIVAARSRGDGA